MKGIIGAITGDIIGSTREFYPIKTKDFELFTPYSRVTDDSILTLAVANWLCEDKNSQDVLIKNLQYFGNRYPDAGYGSSFGGWLVQESPKPYDSWANGSAMRVSPCAWVAESLEEANDLAYKSAIVTHDHLEGIKGALATSDAIYLARIGANKDEIATAYELVRFSEDQFVYWDCPVNEKGYKRDCTPCVFEQYKYTMPVDASTCNVSNAMLSLYEQTGDELMKAKAKALIDNITVVQCVNTGKIPTTWRIRHNKNITFWVNCTYSSVCTLLRMDELSKQESL